jgi:putative holliday junction resolvase
MKILGIDYGRRKVGLARAEGPLAEPWKVLRYHGSRELIQEIKKITEQEKIEKVVVGVSEGEMGAESKKFAEALGAETFDETLSTLEAQQLSREAGIGPKRRKEMEDAYAATVMLQSYLDK